MADTGHPDLTAPPPPVRAAERIFEDEEFPFASGSSNGIKCCTKCGATKTPQWREGPFGPKTLCNACGVKRTRKLRAEQEGAKRRRLSASPAPPHKLAYAPSAPKYASTRLGSQDASVMDRYGSLEPDSEAWGPASGAAARRPPRRAAEEAAFRTARYARTGEWADGGEGAGVGLDERLRAATPSSSSAGASLPSSCCPEEVSWPPLADATGRGSDCYAAVNLMTMSATTAAGGASRAAPPPPAASLPPPFASPASTSLRLEAEQFNHDAFASMAARYSEGSGAVPRPHRVAPVDLDDLASCLPPAKVLELVRLNQELEAAVHEAHAANAAVAAVAQVLACKQAAALSSREAAGAATKRLRRFMSELDTQFGIQSKLAGRRPPLSPTKPGGRAAAPTAAPPLAPLSPVPPPVLPPPPMLEAGTR